MNNCEEISSRQALVCPKPRRLDLFRWHLSCQADSADSNAVTDPLDLILTKGGCGMEQQPCVQVASSPPFFCGSPPSRVSNPLIQDSRFGDEMISPLSPSSRVPSPTQFGLSSSPSSSTRKGGCVRSNFGNNPAVRIEGFDCLDRDRRNCSIPALA